MVLAAAVVWRRWVLAPLVLLVVVVVWRRWVLALLVLLVVVVPLVVSLVVVV